MAWLRLRVASWKARAARRRVRRQRLRVVGLVTGDLPIFGEERDGSGVVVAKGEIHPRSSDRGSWKLRERSARAPRADPRRPEPGDRGAAVDDGYAHDSARARRPADVAGEARPRSTKAPDNRHEEGEWKSPMSKI